MPVYVKGILQAYEKRARKPMGIVKDGGGKSGRMALKEPAGRAGNPVDGYT